MDTYILKKTPFSGVATALATPFSGGEVDLDAFRRLVEWQVDMGIDALCVAGTTGESATLTRAERRRLTVCAKDAANGRVPVIVGCGSADTATACTLCHDAVALGADALLVITPYCNKGTASGIVEQIRAEEGNERYEYFFPMEDPETVLLIDKWRDQAALDFHHKTPMMQQIAALREKYHLRLRVERYISE